MAFRNLKYVPPYRVVEIDIRDFTDAFGREIFSDYFSSQIWWTFNHGQARTAGLSWHMEQDRFHSAGFR